MMRDYPTKESWTKITFKAPDTKYDCTLLVYKDIYTSFHIWKYDIQIGKPKPWKSTDEILHLKGQLLRNLNKNKIVMLESWVETNDI